MEYLSLGIIVKPFSFKGEVKILSSTDFAKKRYLNKQTTFYLANKKGEIIHKVHALSYKKSAGFDVVLFDNVHDEFEAKNLADLEVLIEKDTSVLDKNEYLYVDLISCKIVDAETNSTLGTVVDIAENPAQKCLKVLTNDNTYKEIPFVNAFIKEVDINNKIIYINVIKGLLWDLQF